VPASDLPAALWRRRRLLIATFAVCFAGIVAITLLLPKTYEATATLLVSSGENGAPPSDEVLRSFSALAGNPNTAEAVRRELPFEISRSELLSRMSFTPVDQTQLFEVSARSSSAAEAKTLANIYASVFTARAGDRLAGGSGGQTVAVSEAATLPRSPVKPDVPIYLGLGALLSLALALAAVAAGEALNPRVAVGPTATAVLGEPVLARVPWLGREGPGRGAVSDAVRLLKANIDLSADEPPVVVAVTSAAPAEGRSTIAALLATAHAEAGQRVILVEADFRRPGLHRTPVGDGVERPSAGLAEYLAGAASEDVIAAHPDIPNLDVLWAGTPSDDATGMLGTARLAGLVRALRLAYQHVVFDTPPIGVGADASLVDAAADGVVLVVDVESSRPASARAGLVQLRNVRSRVVGVAVNRAGAGAPTAAPEPA
jgi:capsular exopolysaccharide synthesis family protein